MGVLVFVYYQYNPAPIFFNTYELEKVRSSNVSAEFQQVEKEYQAVFKQKQSQVINLSTALHNENNGQIVASQKILQATQQQADSLRKQAMDLMKKNDPKADTNDTNYVFLNFVMNYLPRGLIGLLIAIIFLAAMGSLASAFNSLASTTVVDVYKRLIKTDASDAHYLAASRWATVGWGVFCIICAFYANKVGNLIEAVNILGSLFYGVILGVFLVAFYVKWVNGTAVFWAAVVSEFLVVLCWWLDLTAFLWLNVIGCLLVVGISIILNKFSFSQSKLNAID